jgi:type II secretory pathway component PulL
VAGVVPGQEAWYLISEGELLVIETFRERFEAERLSWLSQASALRVLAERSQSEAGRLNVQLSTAREAQRRLERSFEQLEQEKLTLLSSKSGKIADLEASLAEGKIQTERYKGQAWGRLLIIWALAGAWVVLIAYKVFRFFRPVL